MAPEQQEQVDVGVRKQLGTSVSADRDGGDPFATGAEYFVEPAANDVVHHLRATGYCAQSVAIREEIRAQPFHLLNVVSGVARHCAEGRLGLRPRR